VQSFREFEAGPDPFGRTWQVKFKWLQTAISLRHSDSVDVKFIPLSDTSCDNTIARHPDMLKYLVCDLGGKIVPVRVK